MSLPNDTAPEHTDPNDFQDTQPLVLGLSAEAHALLANDLGDPSYRIDTYAESLDLMRRVANSHAAATLVVLKPHTEAPEALLAFSARIAEVDEDRQRMEMDLPLGTAEVPKGLMLRGSVRVQGVIVTFECETLGSRHGDDGLSGVLVVRLPFRLYRLQRRDSFRVPLTPQSGVIITLKNGVKPLEHLKALDLSCGGVSVVVRTQLDAVHQGKRFPQATVRLGVGSKDESVHQVDMMVRHVRLAPPGLNKLLVSNTPPPSLVKPPPKPAGKLASNVSAFREAAMAAVGAMPPPELLQLGIEFERMPRELERELAQLVNELGVRLITRVKDDT